MFRWVSFVCKSSLRWEKQTVCFILGTFAIVCLMTGKVVSQHSTEEIMQNGTVRSLDTGEDGAPHYTNIQVATTVTFAVGIIEVSR